jgi:glycosyltransferase involved in cell wall biosynthesis
LIAGKQGILVDTVIEKEHVMVLENLKRNIGLAAAWYEVKTFIELIRILRRLKKKHARVIVHTHCTKAGILGRWAAWIARIKTRIHTIHGFAFHEHQSRIAWWLTYCAEWLTSLITTHFVCVSSADVILASKLFPRFGTKYSLIRAAVEWETFYQPARVIVPEKNNFVFGTVACFKAQKNIFDLLHAFQLVHKQHPHAQLELIGDGVLRTNIESWIAQQGLDQSIVLHGWQDTVAPLMMHWHAFVLSSLWEGLPCAIIEARLLKLPVLSYNTGGISDVITSGRNGLLYPQKDWHALAQGMISLIQSPQLYSQLQTHHDDLHDFNNVSMIKNHQKLYRFLSDT